MQKTYNAIIIGAGAAGLMCAIESGKRGLKTLVIDHNKKPAQKIRISGGGRCNFTNLHTTHENFLSQNPHFCKSALSRYTQHDFIELVDSYGIKHHEKTLGQLFCDNSSQQIIDMLLTECEKYNVEISLETKIEKVTKTEDGFTLDSSKGSLNCKSLIIASGGYSIPKMGATGFGYNIAKQFGHKIIAPYPALVPFIFEGKMLDYVKSMAGMSLNAIAKNASASFTEGMLFTHRGLSGPSILQISSYWQKGQGVSINLSPDNNVYQFLIDERAKTPKSKIHTTLAKILPKKLANNIAEQNNLTQNLADYSNKKLQEIHENISNWQITPDDTEGYRTAEVTAGGVNTNEINPKTFESKKTKNLHFIGEVLDVTGWLGGYNFQWAWSSGHCCGQGL